MAKRIKHFTLLEVLVALAIIAGAVTATMYVMTASARRVQRAERFRMESHRLANAVEFFMLYPPGASMEEKFFPYKDMQVECTYEEPELPEEVDREIDGQRLMLMTVEITDDNNDSVAKISIDRVVEADKL